MVKIINSLIYTLGRITVSGKENLDMLLACINALEALRGEIVKTSEKQEQGNEQRKEGTA